LCRLITESFKDQPKGHPQLSWDQFFKFMGEPIAKGLVCLPTVTETMPWDLLKQSFGQNLFLPLFRFYDGQDSRRTTQAKDLSYRYDVPVVAPTTCTIT